MHTSLTLVCAVCHVSSTCASFRELGDCVLLKLVPLLRTSTSEEVRVNVQLVLSNPKSSTVRVVLKVI